MRVSSLLEFPPRKPVTGWRVWRDIETMCWKLELWARDKCIHSHTSATIFDAKFEMSAIEAELSPEDLELLRIAEIFNEACE